MPCDPRRRLLLAGFGVLALRPALAAGNELTPAAAINRAGRQRMLSQRMAKAFALQVLGVLPERAAQLQVQSQQLFESQLAELAGLLPSDALRAGWKDLDAAWTGYRTVLAGERKVERLPLVLAEADKTLRAAHRLTGLYESLAGGPAGHWVNVAGRQRMLSQRMAKCFLAAQSGLDGGALRQELGEAQREFVAALDELNRAPGNTPEIRTELVLANTQWLFFEQALNGRDSREIAVRNVATTSERILEVMDGLTGRYEKLARA